MFPSPPPLRNQMHRILPWCSSYILHIWVHKTGKTTSKIFNITCENSVLFFFDISLGMSMS